MNLKKTLLPLAMFAALATGSAYAQVNVMLPANPGGGWDGTGRQAFAALNEAGIFTEGVKNVRKQGLGENGGA